MLTHILNRVDYKAFIDGSTRDKLTQSDMGLIPIQLPPIKTQRAIIDFLDREEFMRVQTDVEAQYYKWCKSHPGKE